MFVLSGLFAKTLGLIQVGDITLRAWIWRNIYEPLASPPNASLLYSASFVALFWIVAWVMYRRNWIVRG